MIECLLVLVVLVSSFLGAMLGAWLAVRDIGKPTGPEENQTGGGNQRTMHNER